MKETERRKKLIKSLEEGIAEAKSIINHQAEEIERLREINQFLRDNITGNAEITAWNRFKEIKNAKYEAVMRFGKTVVEKMYDDEIRNCYDIEEELYEELKRIEEKE